MEPLTLQSPAIEPAPTLRPDLNRIVLTGFMGAGKSTIGRMLSAQLGWAFLDLDTLIEERASASVPEIFALQGEARFRRLESSALAFALRSPRTILALGGGAPESLTNRLLLEQTPGTCTIFLHAPFPALFDRCVLQGTVRPVLSDPVEAEQRFAGRLPLYRRLAELTVDTAQHSPEESSRTILAALK